MMVAYLDAIVPQTLTKVQETRQIQPSFLCIYTTTDLTSLPEHIVIEEICLFDLDV